MKRFATITVIGQDKTGVVARVTGYLFEHHANIEALEEKVTRGQFGMTLQASWTMQGAKSEAPGTTDSGPSTRDFELKFRRGLAQIARALGMEITIRFTEPRRKQRFAILVTREPHCFDAIMKGLRSGSLRASPALVVGNHRDLEPRAKKFQLPFAYVPWGDRARAERQVLGLLEQHEVDFVVLARFMKILSPNFVWRYKNKIINIHPSLLPSFPGPQAYRQAYEHGVKIVGVTAHFVSMHLDEGPIIAQGSFQLRSGMTLKQIILAGQKLEAQVLVRAIRLYLTKRLDVYWGIVREV